MTTSECRYSGPILTPRARRVSFGEETLVVDLEDGRQIVVPLAWFPRLTEASEAERAHWRLIGRGIGIHWPDLDEDIAVEGLLATRGEVVFSTSRHESTRQSTPESSAVLEEHPPDAQSAESLLATANEQLTNTVDLMSALGATLRAARIMNAASRPESVTEEESARDVA